MFTISKILYRQGCKNSQWIKNKKKKPIYKKPFMTREEEREISWQRKYTRFYIYKNNSIFAGTNKTIDESSEDCIKNFGQK